MTTSDHKFQMADDKSPLTDGQPPPRRIAFCITELDPGGAEKALFQLVTRLNPREWEAHVYCLGPEAPLAPLIREKGIPVTCFGKTGLGKLQVIQWLTRELNAFRPVILQCFLFHANFIGRLAGRRARVPVIISGHRVAEREKRWHLWLDRWTQRLADQHLCVSRGVADHVTRRIGVPRNRLTVIGNGVEVDLSSPPRIDVPQTFGFPPQSKIVLGVGRLHPQKGFRDLIKSFSRVHTAVPEARLLIIGEGPQRKELERLVHTLHLDEWVRLPGRRQDIPEMMRQAAVFALSSQWEGMPNVVLEAMACRIPIVAMDVEGIRDLIIHQRSGIIVKPGDLKGFEDSLIEILQTPQLGDSLAREAQTIAKKQFTWDAVVRDYTQFYRRLID